MHTLNVKQVELASSSLFQTGMMFIDLGLRLPVAEKTKKNKTTRRTKHQEQHHKREREQQSVYDKKSEICT